MDLCLSFSSPELAGVKSGAVGQQAGCLRDRVGQVSSDQQVGGEKAALLTVLLPRAVSDWAMSPLGGPSAAQQELPVVSGAFPELQGSCPSCHRERTVEKAPRQVPGAQDVQRR